MPLRIDPSLFSEFGAEIFIEYMNCYVECRSDSENGAINLHDHERWEKRRFDRLWSIFVGFKKQHLKKIVREILLSPRKISTSSVKISVPYSE